MFVAFLFALREAGVPVGIGEWLALMRALRLGLATDLDQLYRLSRALLCRTEAEFDRFDQAFLSTFEGVTFPEDVASQLEQWLAEVLDSTGEWADHTGRDPDELLREFLERLAEQTEKHDGGNRWIGTGGTSSYGHSGRSRGGVRVGGSGGGRSAMRTAMERRWENYRSDRSVDVRDLKVVLRMLRSLVREGRPELDIDETIDQTAKQAGDITLVERPERRNRLELVLLMDAGGSMAPHAQRVEKLFSAASQVKIFKSFTSYYFHNCVYGRLYTDFEKLARIDTQRVLSNLTPKHRLIFVGDASMAPYELFATYGWPGDGSPSGLEWLKRFRARCPASIWLNPDPPRWWKHPTVSAIGGIFPMFELTVDGLDRGVRKLRAPS